MRTQVKVFKIPAPTHIELVLNKWLAENEHILINGMYMISFPEKEGIGFYVIVAYSFEEWRAEERV